jgi:multidrug efflux pump subunit AcrA (membrane-fusion protein)
MARRDGLRADPPALLRSRPLRADAAAMTSARPVPAEVLQRARAARERLAALQSEREALVVQRDAAIRELSALGLSYDAIAEVAGVSRARVGQIVTRPRTPS